MRYRISPEKVYVVVFLILAGGGFIKFCVQSLAKGQAVTPDIEVTVAE